MSAPHSPTSGVDLFGALISCKQVVTLIPDPAMIIPVRRRSPQRTQAWFAPEVDLPMTGAGVFVLRDPTTLVPMQAASFAPESSGSWATSLPCSAETRSMPTFHGASCSCRANRPSARKKAVRGAGRPIASSSTRKASRRWSKSSAAPAPDPPRGRRSNARPRCELDRVLAVEELRQCFETRCEAEGQDAGAVLATLMGSEEQVEGF